MTNTIASIVAAIRIIEGVHSTHPYGIIIKNHHYTSEQARVICTRTILHYQRDYIKQHRHDDFLNYCADRYCPPSVDAIGNKNWKTNIHKLIK